MKLNSKKFFYIMTGVIVLLGIITIASVAAANSILAKKNERLMELKLENEMLDRQKQDMTIARANIKKYEELEKIAGQIVPQDKDQTRTVREIVRFAEQSGIKIQSISFPSSNLGQRQPTTARPSGGDSSTPAPSAPATPPITQVKPVSGMSGVYELEVQVQSGTGTDFPKLIRFLRHLEANRRTSQVSNLVVSPSPTDRNVLGFTMSLKVYVKP